jgi:hypothetical protein
MSAINLYTSKTLSHYFRDSQVNNFYEFGGIQLLPNNTYTQKSTGIELGNGYTISVLKVADDSLLGYLLFSLVEVIYLGSIYADSTFFFADNNSTVRVDSNASGTYWWSITPTEDFGNDLIYLKFTNGTTTRYTNPFYITALDEDNITNFTYKDLASNQYEKIGLKTWFRQKSKHTELITYYESSTGKTVTQGIKTKDLEMYESEFMSIEDLIMTAEILENPYLFIGNTRYYLYESVKIPEITQQENFAKIKFTLAVNN